MEHVLRIAISVGLSLINNLSTGGAHRDDLRPALRLPIIATLAIIMLLGVIPATLPQSSAHAASGYLADEIGNTEINVDVDEEFAVVLWVVDAVELAGYDCKITLSGPGTAIGEAAHGDWFADGHSVFDGLSTADYRTAMLTSPTDITGSGDVVVFTIRADEEGTIAINVDTDYFFLADTEGNKMEMTVPSTLYINVSGGDRMESSGEDTSSSRDGGEGLLDAGTFTLKVRWEDLQFGSSVEFFLWVDGVAVNDCFAPFEQEVDADSTVRLVAGDPSGYDFLRWKVDGVSQDEGDDDITFVMTKNKIAVMVFARNCTLNVKSEGKTPVLVNGGKFGEEYGEYSGYTDYEVTSIPAGTEVALSPDDDSDFYCWDIDGVLLEQQGSSIHFTINWDCTATAIFYADLTVDTQPSHVVAFDWTTNFRGMSGGGTDYTPCDYEDEKGTTQFTLELSPSYLQFEDSGITYVFHHWELGSVPQEPGKTSITFILHADSSAIAVYGRQWFVDSQGGADFTTIQAAIDDSSVHDGDTVVVNPGTYSLHGNRDIELKGKAITLTSAQNLALAQDPTIIDCGGTEQDPHRAFYVHEGELNATSIEGFIIQNGYAKGIEDFESGGGAICCQGTLPVIRNNIFRANYAAGAGGAIRCEGHESQVLGGMLIIEGNTFRDEVGENPFNGNNANRTGGAITCARYEAVLIKDNVESVAQLQRTATPDAPADLASAERMTLW